LWKKKIKVATFENKIWEKILKFDFKNDVINFIISQPFDDRLSIPWI
jgi:hypothetical protein